MDQSKGWMATIAITAQFVTKDAPLETAAIVALVFVAAGATATMTWVLFGRVIGRMLQTPGRLRAFNLTMALILLGH